MKPVAIIGGGPAGIAAACTLAEKGVPTILFERASRLGGRASSFVHPRMQEQIDYGQHVLMRSCTQMIALLHRLGIPDALAIQSRMRIPIAWAGGRTELFSRALPGPAHLLPSLLRYQPLSFCERLAVLHAGLALLARKPAKGLTFGQWLARHGQGENAIARLWEPICVATLNAHVDKVSVRSARMVFTTGFFKPHGADLALFTRPLSAVFSSAIPYLAARGGEVRLHSPVQRILINNGKVSAIELNNEETIAAEAVIAALPPRDLLPLLPVEVRGSSFFSRLAEIPFAPIIDLHLWFDRSVMADPFLISVEPPLQAIFDVSQIIERKGPTHLVLSQSATEEWIDLPVEVIAKRLIAALSKLLPETRTARMVDQLVIKHPRATLVPTPTVDELRPSARTPISGLYLAGDYTATGWPSTIEGAIRSGVRACFLTFSDEIIG